MDKCKDKPTAELPLTIMCVSCGGDGGGFTKDTLCEECNGACENEIACCPLEFITDDITEAIEYADLYAKGLPPIVGGALDQAKSFTSACRFIWGEERYWKNRLGIIG